MKKTLLFAVGAVLLLTGCDKAKTNEYKVNIKNADGVSTEYVVTKSNDVIITVKNNTDKKIDYVGINSAIYDKDGNLLTVDKQSLRNLNAKAENVVKISAFDLKEKEVPAKVDLRVNTMNYENELETVYTDKVEGKVEKTDVDGQLSLTLTNNSGVTLSDLSAVVVFYKDSKIVDLYPISVQNVSATHQETIYVPTVKEKDTYKTIEYDDTKVIINNASVYNN